MNVLIANWRSDLFRGTEIFVRDLALGLARRGHAAVVYCDGAIDIGRPMTAAGISVCRDLDSLPFRPDIVHGQFVGEGMAAVVGLPDVPAIFFCHGAISTTAVPKHPRIYRYAVMTPTLGTRLVVESAIEESAIDVVLNTVDLSRFTGVREPPPRPARALFYNSDHRPGGPLTLAIQAAAAASGLALDLIGLRFGRMIERPEEVLLDYDIVFAAGKSALDALACGCAVITVGMTSCGEIVTVTNFDRMRRGNFSAGVNSAPPSPEAIGAEIARYAPDACAAVTRRVRREADGEVMISQMEAIYEKAIAAHRNTPRDALAEQYAMARYFRKLAPLVSLAQESLILGDLMPTKLAAARQFASAQMFALEQADENRK